MRVTQFASLRSPFRWRAEPSPYLVFDPFPGGRVFVLSERERDILGYLLGDSGAPPGLSTAELLHFVNTSPEFLDADYQTLGSRPIAEGALPVTVATADSNSKRQIIGFPIRATYLITRLCNAKCAYCTISTLRSDSPHAHQPGALPSRDQVAELASLGIVGFALHGGEPLLVADLPRFVSQLAFFGFAISVSTRIPKESEYWLAMKHGGLALLQHSVELNAVSREMLCSIEAASRAGLDVIVNVVLTRDNVSHLPANIEAVRRILDAGAREIRFERMLPAYGRPLPRSLFPDELQVSEFARMLRSKIGAKAVFGAQPIEPEDECDSHPADLIFADDGYVYPCDRLAYSVEHRLHNWRIYGFADSVQCEKRSSLPCPFAERSASI